MNTTPDKQWVALAEAASLTGCSASYLRRLLRDERLRGWRAGDRAWLVRRSDLMRLRAALTTRSTLRAAERKSLHKPPKKRA